VRVALIHKFRFPVQGYGGTERLVWWIAKGLHEIGVDVTLVAEKGSQCPFARVVTDFDWARPFSLPDVDVLHLFNTPRELPERPHLITIGGNGKPGEKFLPNTVFVSQNHALRHGSKSFVHNALDPSEYIFQEKKSDSLLFLAKASWKVKNVNGAIRIARKSGRSLKILGGKRWFLNHWRGIHWEGMLSGEPKARIIAESQGLLFPVIWDEPFGIAVIEALVSGTPVLASRQGSLPELVTPEVGKICDTEAEFVEAVPSLKEFSAKRCRDYVMEKFHYHRMAKDYLSLYERVASGNSLS
jgi:hypothetical protein